MRPDGRLGRVALAAVAALVAIASCGGGIQAATWTRDQLAARWAAANHRPVRVLDGVAASASPPSGLRALLAAELARKGVFHLAASGPPPVAVLPWYVRLWRWLGDRWDRLIAWLFGRTRVGKGGAVAFGYTVVVAVCVLVLFFTIRLIRDFQFERRSRVRSVQGVPSSADARALFAAACERARRGDYGDASRLLFGASIGVLALRGAVREDRSATVGEFRRALRSRDASLVSSFDAIAAAFVTSAYAERPVDEAAWDRARDAYLTIAREVPA